MTDQEERATEPAATDAWSVFCRGMRCGATWGAVAGLPLTLVAVQGLPVGIAAGLVCSVAPSAFLAVQAPSLRRNLISARSGAALLAALPALAFALQSGKPGGREGLLACGLAAGLIAALLTRRILNGRVARCDDNVPLERGVR